ncbi:uncharacterized protein LOC127721202 [Mytilus californianus]|uniref:uncharacterized protein LOC127721202 n=1 Tax=Mytilus californianus TaxID=6549 RepID=UPI002246BF15|nr:uncharacterized protein LOC127721202 [Mytilus californianus]XP_052083846.1 uncharacterized protein LOC127721202 [Mytilus californianus]XP_052083847.1 uncharacterized protein LOC127721202 [Mytilus californianus]
MEKCKTVMCRGLLPTRQLENKSLNDSRHDNRNSQEALTGKLYSNEEDDSVWLFDTLHIIGANDDYRKSIQRESIKQEILSTFGNPLTCYNMGSTFEGAVTPDEPNDIDRMRCDEMFPVVEHTASAKHNLYSLLIVRELFTPAGYVKLQLVMGNKPCTSTDWPLLCVDGKTNNLKIDRFGRIVLYDFLMNPYTHQLFSRPKNKPAIKFEKYYDLNVDTVISYRCKTWPTMADEWLSRQRCHGWPTKYTIQELKSLGFFVVRKGHPFSSELDLEWRVSFSLQERKLMFNLTDVQHKCYIVLKMLNRDVINLDCITTYHWKTCLFYVIENSKSNVWEKKNLFHCITLCIKQMLKWVKYGVCPNYFIPRENLFDGRLNGSLRLTSENILEELLNVGFECLLLVKRNNICDYVRSRGSSEWYEWLQANSKKLYNEAIYIVHTRTIVSTLSAFNHDILEHFYYQANEDVHVFVDCLWFMLDRIQYACTGTFTEHTQQETNNSLSLLKPYIFTCLASNVSAMAIRHPNPQVRDFLLLGSCLFFMKGDLPGRLKLISVLYAARLYADCEWWLDKLNEECKQDNPSICNCRYIKSDSSMAQENIINTSSLRVLTCVSFLPTELSIAPDALTYEIFRYFGISLNEKERAYKRCLWHYRAVVDCNIYFFLLKYVIKKKLGRFKESEDARYRIYTLLLGKNVRHRDVANNLLAWTFCSNYETPLALMHLAKSWEITNSWDLCFMILTDEMKQKQYQFNSAKLHTLVILYSTWYARNPSLVHFCFQCLFISEEKLLICSRCKISTYCSKQCQIANWKIHKTVCKIVRSYRTV